MNDFYDMNMYVITMLARCGLSFIICVISLTGLSIASTNNIKHSYFEFMYFFVVFMSELGMMGFYIFIYRKQRGLKNLDPVSNVDCKGSCLALFLRLGWHLSLSLFIVVRINMGEYLKQNRKWREV